ncbi:MAG: protein O-mannosyl-transferase family [Verrucomicrobiia bacterium]
MSDSPVPIGTTESAPSIPQAHGRFFSARDSIAFLLASVVSFAVYLCTLAPGVTLENAGELLTASHSLGVPNPPGYAAWTLLAAIWQRIVPLHNIAWRVNLMCALLGALAVGLLALLISKSGRVMASRCGFLQGRETGAGLDWIILASSVSAAWMLAFSPAMWSQSVITEAWTLNVFLLVAILVLLYRWSLEPERCWQLYLAGFLWGVSLTNHQTLVLLAVAFPTFLWFVDRELGRDVLAPMLAVIVLAVAKMIVSPGSLFWQGAFAAAWVLGHGVGAGVWLRYLWKQGSGLMRMWRRALAIYATVVLGMSLYAYVPLSSATNPPINGTYGHGLITTVYQVAISQYESVHAERSPLQFWGQINMFFDDLKSQFTIVYALIALLAMLFYRDLAREDRRWLLFLLIAFLFLALDLIFFSNPSFERRRQYPELVSFLPCHCLYALWIGYGLILGCGNLVSERPSPRKITVPLAALVAALPLASLALHWAGSEQHAHDFGYQFGYLVLEPGGGYPDMDKGAILLGGADQGRFLPTYMTVVESQVPPSAKTQLAKYPGSESFDRHDVYIITQNALADGRYLRRVRDHYGADRPDSRIPKTVSDLAVWERAVFEFGWRHLGRDTAYPRDPIWLPNDDDVQAAIRQYVDELRIRHPLPGEEVKIEGGRVSLQGVTSVMAVNGYLAKALFDHNKDQHTFYVEESYTIPWMYPYLEPFGLIFRINRDPIPKITPNMIVRDRAWWDALFEDLHNDPRFQRDEVAQRTFSKLRSTVGGLYAFRLIFPEAEYAFRQAIALCPESPDANFRLAQLYVELGRFDGALAVLKDFAKHDPYNPRIPDFIDTVLTLKQQSINPAPDHTLAP